MFVWKTVSAMATELTFLCRTPLCKLVHCMQFNNFESSYATTVMNRGPAVFKVHMSILNSHTNVNAHLQLYQYWNINKMPYLMFAERWTCEALGHSFNVLSLYVKSCMNCLVFPTLWLLCSSNYVHNLTKMFDHLVPWSDTMSVTFSRRVFILGPSHHVPLSRCALSSADVYRTPLYDLRIDQKGICS